MEVFVFFFIFSVIGMHFWGGKIHYRVDLPNNVPKDYVMNNFNDMASGMITLFELLIVNNWQFNVAMYVAVSGSKWVKVYFITWYFIAVILGLNLLISFILEIYVSTITQFEVIDLKEMER